MAEVVAVSTVATPMGAVFTGEDYAEEATVDSRS
jgi:hypothetical protein